eukprot:scaffold15331_cov39-Phaeocystis_antarctica.AAC.1
MFRCLPPQVQPALALKDSSTPRPALTYVVSGPGWGEPPPPKPKYPAPGSTASCDSCGGNPNLTPNPSPNSNPNPNSNPGPISNPNPNP